MNRRIMLIALAVVIVMILAGIYFVIQMVDNVISSKLEFYHKKATWQSNQFSDYFNAFPLEADFFAGKNNFMQILEKDEIEPDIFRNIKELHNRHQAALDSIIINNGSILRRFGHIGETSLSRGKLEPSWLPLQKIKSKEYIDHSLIYCYPVKNASGEVVGNIIFKLNIFRYFQETIIKDTFDRSTWVFVIRDGKIDFVYSDNEKFVENAEASIPNFDKNSSNELKYNHIGRKAVLNYRNMKIDIMYAYQAIPMFDGQIGLIFAGERKMSLSVLYRLVLFLSILFFVIIGVTVWSFTLFIRTLRKEELELARGRNAVDNANNLISNACKFSHTGSQVTINMQNVQDNKIRISVTDTGIGIPEEFKNRIFRKFAQVDSSDSRSKGGTGLGLSISKAIIEKFGGTISYESEQGKGTSFFFELPLIGEEIKISPQKSEKSKADILIVEDEPDIQEITRSALELVGGFEVYSAFNGTDGIQVAGTFATGSNSA